MVSTVVLSNVDIKLPRCVYCRRIPWSRFHILDVDSGTEVCFLRSCLLAKRWIGVAEKTDAELQLKWLTEITQNFTLGTRSLTKDRHFGKALDFHFVVYLHNRFCVGT